MPETVDRDHLIELLSGSNPVAAGMEACAIAPPSVVTYSRSGAPDQWLVDGEREGPLDAHRAAHAAGRASEATVLYGSDRSPAQVADRLLELAGLRVGPGALMAVCPLPGVGGAARPGSWGVEDLSVVAATRVALPEVPWVRPNWHLLGAPACQVALAFGANDWQVPEEDDTDLAALADAVGVTAVAR